METYGLDGARKPRKDSREQNPQQDGVVGERLQGVEARRLDRVVPHAGQGGGVDLVPEGRGHDVAVPAQVGDVEPGERVAREGGRGKQRDEGRGQGVEPDHAVRILGHPCGKESRWSSAKRSLPPAIIRVSGMASRPSASIRSVSRRMSHWAWRSARSRAMW